MTCLIFPFFFGGVSGYSAVLKGDVASFALRGVHDLIVLNLGHFVAHFCTKYIQDFLELLLSKLPLSWD